jgi:hypothetical protein
VGKCQSRAPLICALSVLITHHLDRYGVQTLCWVAHSSVFVQHEPHLPPPSAIRHPPSATRPPPHAICRHSTMARVTKLLEYRAYAPGGSLLLPPACYVYHMGPRQRPGPLVAFIPCQEPLYRYDASVACMQFITQQHLIPTQINT